MNELGIHLRKDVKLLTSDSLFVIFMAVLAVASFFIALTTCAGYVQQQTYSSSVVTKASLQADQATTLVSYWSSIGSIFIVIFTGVAAMAMSVEKDSGMSRYTLSHKVRGPVFFMSKMIVVALLAAIAMLMALIAYLITFSVMDVPMLGADKLAASMLFPFLSILVFASLGLALSTLGSKKGAMVAVAIVVLIILSALYPISIAIGQNAAMRVDPTLTYSNYTKALPLENQLLIYGNPMVLSEGSSYLLGTLDYNTAQLYDPAGGVILAAVFYLAFTALGLVLFSRERMDKTWSEKARRSLKLG
ncbi:MAG: ABC transporter permease subunit [Methanomassiliicoccus sp.]|nr:ABC transporter permease subunit [Methanomassiliicoccus sp.]